MKLPFTVYVGLRYTGAKRRNQLVSFLSKVSIAGLVVGVALLVAVLSVINGFEKELHNKILGLIPHAVIKHHQGIEDWNTLGEELENHPDVLEVAPYIQQNALISYRKNTEPVVFYGVDPAEEQKVSNITSYIGEEDFSRLNDPEPQIILGRDIAKKLGVKPGKKLMLIVPDSKQVGGAPKIAYFRVLATVDSGTELDNALVLSSLEHASKLSSSPFPVTGMRLKVGDIFDAQDLVYRVLANLGPGYSGNNWMRVHGNLSHSIKVSKRMVGLLMSLVVAIALFNIVSTLVMVVMDKQGDIAILRTLGASTGKIMRIFLVQGCAIGLIGTLFGILGGCILAWSAEDLVKAVEALFDTQFLKSDVYPVTYLPTQIRFSDLLTVGMTSFVLSFLATLYPAWRASKIQPAEALRYE